MYMYRRVTPYIGQYRTAIQNIGADTMERWTGQVALVTGASMGIGAAIAETLVTNGMVVVGCARHVEPIQVCI